jgi:hypothetical protein
VNGQREAVDPVERARLPVLVDHAEKVLALVYLLPALGAVMKPLVHQSLVIRIRTGRFAGRVRKDEILPSSSDPRTGKLTSKA